MSFVREAGAEPIPGYRLIELLGTGGFGEVWKCEAPGGLFKAIKFVYGNLNAGDGDSARAEQELNALNRVKEVRNLFVLSMDRIEVVEGELVIVMELADRSLHDCFTECQAAGLVGIPRDDLLRYVRDAAEALDYMYDKHRLQHLDIKPRNLFLIGDRAKVADFGLVKGMERQSGSLTSVTPLYAPPEVFQGNISQHSDQYSLAIVYQELLTGQRPFTGKTPRQLVLAHSQLAPELRALPEGERDVVARALSKEPAQRFPNCLSFVRALYTARRPPKLHAIEPTINGQGRPKSLAETMENILLEQGDTPPADDSGLVITQHVEAIATPASGEEIGRTISLPQSGALRPTLILGLGGFGRRALVELRCRFLDRFGDLAKIPLVRFLYVDSDAEAVKHALQGAPETACASSEICHLPLQAVGNYRRRILEQLSEWLPREKLYAMPRALETQGSRALGRLAFADNHRRLLGRLRREIEHATHPDTVYESVNQTGLALRDNRPRVYVIGAAGGGAGGLLVDLGYALRRLLQQLGHRDAEITTLLFCGAPDDPATPKAEQANVYATLTELNHFMDSSVAFTAQYGPDEPRTVDQSHPFRRVYLLKLAHRGPEALRDAVAHLGSYLFHELTTPLGLRLDRLRATAPPAGATPFRSFGTYAVWFPRGLLLRQAARQACAQLMGEWQRSTESTAAPDVEATCARLQADPELRFEAICNRLQETIATSFDGNLNGALTNFLSALDEQSQQSVAQDDPANWTTQALTRVQEWVGLGHDSESDSGWRKSRLGRALLGALQKQAGEWDQRLSEAAFKLMELPGARVAAAEAGCHRLVQFCQETAAAHEASIEKQLQQTRLAWQQLERAAENCRTGAGGFSLFGGRSRRLLRVFMDHLTAFSRQRLLEELFSAGQQFFNVLAARLGERLRELAFCRQRLRAFQDTIEDPPDDLGETPVAVLGTDQTITHGPASAESYWDEMRGSQTTRLVLPDGETDLAQAARRFVDTLGADQWTQLDQTLQDRVLAALGGLHRACSAGGDFSRYLGESVLGAAVACLSEFLPVTDVAEAEFSAAAADFPAYVQGYFEQAAPLLAAQDGANQRAFLLLPASKDGARFGEQAQAIIPALELVKVPGQADLMFCREQDYLRPDDLQRVFRACRQVYEEMAAVPITSPHARFDILDWVPLDP